MRNKKLSLGLFAFALVLPILFSSCPSIFKGAKIEETNKDAGAGFGDGTGATHPSIKNIEGHAFATDITKLSDPATKIVVFLNDGSYTACESTGSPSYTDNASIISSCTSGERYTTTNAGAVETVVIGNPMFGNSYNIDKANGKLIFNGVDYNVVP